MLWRLAFLSALVLPIFVWADCPDITLLYDSNELQTIKPYVVYKKQTYSKAQLYCMGNYGDDIVELVTDSGSMGIEDYPKTAICRLGRWYALDKRDKLMPIKTIACIRHTYSIIE